MSRDRAPRARTVSLRTPPAPPPSLDRRARADLGREPTEILDAVSGPFERRVPAGAAPVVGVHSLRRG